MVNKLKPSVFHLSHSRNVWFYADALCFFIFCDFSVLGVCRFVFPQLSVLPFTCHHICILHFLFNISFPFQKGMGTGLLLLLLLPVGYHFRVFWGHWYSGIHCTCPYHCNALLANLHIIEHATPILIHISSFLTLSHLFSCSNLLMKSTSTVLILFLISVMRSHISAPYSMIFVSILWKILLYTSFLKILFQINPCSAFIAVFPVEILVLISFSHLPDDSRIKTRYLKLVHNVLADVVKL